FFVFVFGRGVNFSLPAFDVGSQAQLARRHRNAVVVQTAGTRPRVDLLSLHDALPIFIRIGEAKIRRRKGVGGIFIGGDGLVGPRRRVVHRGDVDRKGIGRLVEIVPAIGGAAVVLHLEGEARSGRVIVICVGRRRVLQP